MSPEEFLREFGHLAETEGGISQLRRTVRQLGVMGRLVEHNINDVPAGVLVREAQEYRQEKLGKKAKAVPEIADAEWPYHLPYSWAWVRLGELTWRSQYGTSQKAHTHDSGIPVLRMGNIVDGTLDYTNMKFVSESTEGVGELLLEEGDLIFNRTNSFEQVGKMAVFRDKERPITLASYLIRLSLCPVVVPEYVNIYFGTPICRSTQIEPSITKQTNQANFNGTKLASVLLPLPPLSEQKRIVEKVDQLMALCDELETKQKHKREKAVSVNKAALSAVVHAPDKFKLKSGWSRVQDHFEVLYELPENVKELRQTILQLAVTGKLVRQEERDEPAKVLLARIPDERAKATGLGKTPSVEFTLAAHLKGLALPAGWAWAPWAALLLGIESGWSPQCESFPRGPGTWGVLKVSAVSWDRFDENENKQLPEKLTPRPEAEVKQGDFLMSRANTADLVGRSVIVESVVSMLLMSDKILRCHFSSEVNPKYVNLVNQTWLAREHYATLASGTSASMKNISREVVGTVPIPLPPRREQDAIVKRVFLFMSLCDDLDAQLAQHRDQGQRLMQAVVEGLVA